MPRTYVPTGRPVGRPRKPRGPSLVIGKNAEERHLPGNVTVFSRPARSGEIVTLDPQDDDAEVADTMHGITIGIGCYRTPARGSGC